MTVQEALYVRFPNGFREVAFSMRAPEVGDKLRRGEDEWEVIAVEKDATGHMVVTLGAGNRGKPEES